MSRAVREEAEATRQRRPLGRVLLGLVSITGFFALLMFASALQGYPVFAPAQESGPAVTVTPEPQPEMTQGPLPEIPPQEDSPVLTAIAIVVAVIIGAAILLMLFFGIRLLVRTLRGLWRDRPLARRVAAEVSVGGAETETPSSEPEAEVVRRGVAQALRAIGDGAEPGDSIIAAWQGLEETAADAGVVRARSETAAEFTVRILAHRPSTSGEVATLLRLFEDVRFGGRVADEADRRTAIRCLRAIEEGWR